MTRTWVHLDPDSVFGDNGETTLLLRNGSADIGEIREMVSLTAPFDGEYDDVIFSGNGEDRVIGGQGADCIDTGDIHPHNAVDDAQSQGRLEIISINFNSGIKEGLVTANAGVAADADWNNFDNRGLNDGDDGDDDDDDDHSRPETFVTHESLQVTVGQDLDQKNPRAAATDNHNGINPDTQNGYLFNGYVHATGDNTLGVDIDGIEFESYDVYVYLDADDGITNNRNPIRSITDGDTTFLLMDRDGNRFVGEYVLTGPGPAATGNYVVFKNVTGSNFSLRIDGSGGSDNDDDDDGRHRSLPALAGMQIVGGPDKDDVIRQGDYDTDRVLGDQGHVRVFEGQVFEMISEPLGLTGAHDIVHTGIDGDLVIGGDGGDRLHGQNGDDINVGDHARAIFFFGEVIGLDLSDSDGDDDDDDGGGRGFNPFKVLGLQLLAPQIGGQDTIEGGRGDDWSFGGFADDTYVFDGLNLGTDWLVEAGDLSDNDDDDDDGGNNNRRVPIPGSAAFANDTGDLLDFGDYDASVKASLALQNTQVINGFGNDGDDDDDDGGDNCFNLAIRLFSDNAFEDISGSVFSDRLDGNTRNNTLQGNAGHDLIRARFGSDFIDGGPGNDWLYADSDSDDGDGGDGDDDDDDGGSRDYSRNIVLGGSGIDRIRGASGADLLAGESGNDDIRGGRGNDILFGGLGIDRLRGDSGRDLLDPSNPDAVIRNYLGFFEAGFARADFSWLDTPGEDFRRWVTDFLEEIPGYHGLNLMAAAEAEGEGSFEILTDSRLQSAAEAARAHWIGTGLLNEHEIAMLEATRFEISDLPGLVLGRVQHDLITVDIDAAGHGWFTQPGDYSDAGQSYSENVIGGRFDLVSALSHEMGHLLGYDHDETALMDETLAAGVRELPGQSDAAAPDITDREPVTIPAAIAGEKPKSNETAIFALPEAVEYLDRPGSKTVEFDAVQFALPEAVDHLGLPSSAPIEHAVIDRLVFDDASGGFIDLRIQHQGESAVEVTSRNGADLPMPDQDADWIIYRSPDDQSVDADSAPVIPSDTDRPQLVNWDATTDEVDELLPDLLPARVSTRNGFGILGRVSAIARPSKCTPACRVEPLVEHCRGSRIHDQSTPSDPAKTGG